MLKRAKLVYLYLSDRQGTAEETWPGITTMARDLSMSRSTVIRAIADLEKAGYLRKELSQRANGSLTSNRFHNLK